MKYSPAETGSVSPDRPATLGLSSSLQSSGVLVVCNTASTESKAAPSTVNVADPGPGAVQRYQTVRR
jgi:hypothetical protein